MHYRNIELLFQSVLYFKTFGSFYIFKVYTSESGSYCLYCLNKSVGVFFIHFNIEHIDTCKYFKQQAFTFHNRFPGKCAYIAKSQHGGTVRYYCHEIPFCCIFVRIVRILLYFKTRLCNTRRIRKRKIHLRTVRFCRNHLYLSRFPAAVIFKSIFFRNFRHTIKIFSY